MFTGLIVLTSQEHFILVIPNFFFLFLDFHTCLISLWQKPKYCSNFTLQPELI